VPRRRKRQQANRRNKHGAHGRNLLAELSLTRGWIQECDPGHAIYWLLEFSTLIATPFPLLTVTSRRHCS
jgi:hypothetical protein